MFILLAIILILISCGPTQITAPHPVPISIQPDIAPIKAVETFEGKWENLVRAARREGIVMVYYSQPPGLRAFVDLFMDRFGLRLETVAGNTSVITARVQSEYRAGLNIVDVVLAGRTSSPKEISEPLGPVFILPELTEPELIKKTWWRGQLWWVDEDPRMLSSQAAPASLLAINTNMVKSGELKSFNDLLNTKWKGKIVIGDPGRTSGATLTVLKVVSTQIMSKNWEFARALANQEPVFTFDERLQAEWIARGKYPIAVAPSSGQIAILQEAGAPIEFVTPEEGGFIGSGSNIVNLVKNSPHPNAAKLFINFFLSKEGQTIYTRTIGVHSAREDVPTEGINPQKLRQPRVKYYFPDLVNLEDREIAQQIFGHLISK